MSRTSLKGFRDFFPQELAERAYITDRWREVARRYGFVEYDGPPLEPLELYTRKSGQEIVDQLYAFTDKGGREVALRPEMTPTLARMVGSRANTLRRPVRWFSIPQLFRYERQQRGRLREHFQLNVDIIGESDVSADAELLATAVDIMRSFGLTADDIRARVSDRQLLQGLLVGAGVNSELLPAVYAIVDKMEREPQDLLEDRLLGIGVSKSTSQRIFEILKTTDLGALRHDLGNPPALRQDFERLSRYLAYLEALGVAEWITPSLSVVRGLAYYTGIVFELFDARGEFRAICGGGRYDTLLGAIGGADLPALGFGMGDVVLGEILRARGLMPQYVPSVDVWVTFADAAMLPDAMRVTTRLRQSGFSVEYALGGQKLARQFKAADAAGAREVLVLSPELLPRRQATVRRMADGTEKTVVLDTWLPGATQQSS